MCSRQGCIADGGVGKPVWEGMLLKCCSAPGKLHQDFRMLPVCPGDSAEQAWGLLCIPSLHFYITFTSFHFRNLCLC